MLLHLFICVRVCWMGFPHVYLWYKYKSYFSPSTVWSQRWSQIMRLDKHLYTLSLLGRLI